MSVHNWKNLCVQFSNVLHIINKTVQCEMTTVYYEHTQSKQVS